MSGFLVSRGGGGGGGGGSYNGLTPDYYISTTGSDSNDGSSGSPWAITALNTKRATYKEKTLGIKDGTYNVYSNMSGIGSAEAAFDITTAASGTSGTRTIIVAETARSVIIEGRSGGVTYPGANGSCIEVTGEYVTIDGLKFQGFVRRGVCQGGAEALGEPTRQGFVLKNCEFTAFDGSAAAGGLNLCQVELNDALGPVIQNCYFHDNIGYDSSDDHFSCLEVWSSAQGVYEYNTVENQAGGFMGKAQEHEFYENIIRYNYIDTPGTAGVYGWNEGTSHQSTPTRGPTEIHHNVIIATRPIWAHNIYQGTDSRRFFHDLKIWNNTLIQDPTEGMVLTANADASVDMYIYNNIMQRGTNSGDLQGFYFITPNATTLINYNHQYQSSGTHVHWTMTESGGYASGARSSHSGISAFRTAMGNNDNGTTIDASGQVGTDPNFVATGTTAHYYELDTGSPDLGTGKSDGTSSGSDVDRGAFGNGLPTPAGRTILIGFDSSVRM